MGEETTVSLHGMWASPYARWIKIALKIKGINYEYVEENLKKKSQILLRYNPIYKKVPLLIHDNNPIIESLVILQYIDDTWKVSQPLLPLDSYSRYIVRFWADFIINQVYYFIFKIIFLMLLLLIVVIVIVLVVGCIDFAFFHLNSYF